MDTISDLGGVLPAGANVGAVDEPRAHRRTRRTRRPNRPAAAGPIAQDTGTPPEGVDAIFDGDTFLEEVWHAGAWISGFSAWIQTAATYPHIRLRTRDMRSFKAKVRYMARKLDVRVGIQLDGAAWRLTYRGER